MKKLIKKFLASSFAIAGIFLASNKCFAKNYEVDIIVLGNAAAGKSNFINRAIGGSFCESHIPTRWDEDGVTGFHREFNVNGDTFKCYFYDAPGFLKEDNCNVSRQLDLVDFNNIKLAILIVDPRDKNYDRSAENPVHQAMTTHMDYIKKKNPNSNVILVITKMDMLSANELEDVKGLQMAARIMYRSGTRDAVIVSSKTGEGFDEFEKIFKNYLAQSVKTFDVAPSGAQSFKVCNKCKRKFTVEDTGFRRSRIPGKFYCSEDCLRRAEGKPCGNANCIQRKLLLDNEGVEGSNSKRYCCLECKRAVEGKECSNHKCRHNTILLDGDGVKSSETGRVYCDKDCLRVAEGEDCGNRNCPDRKKLLPREGYRGKKPGYYRYCSIRCCREAEGELCSYKKCPNRQNNRKFLHIDQGVVEYEGKLYCSQNCKDWDNGCTIM